MRGNGNDFNEDREMSDIKKIRILFYKTPWVLKLKYWVNWLISIRTVSKYSHCELWEADEQGRFMDYVCTKEGQYTSFVSEGCATGTVTMPEYRLDIYGTCTTATMRGDANGTVSRDASTVLKHPENWDYVEIEVSEEQASSLRTWMQYQVDHNKGYSKWDILKFVVPVHFPDEIRNICSEFVNNGLAAIGFFKSFGIVSPGKVAKKLLAKGYGVNNL